MKLKPNINYPSEVLVASNARPSKNSISTKEKAPLNFQAYASRDIETAVREGFRVGQKMSLC